MNFRYRVPPTVWLCLSVPLMNFVAFSQPEELQSVEEKPPGEELPVYDGPLFEKPDTPRPPFLARLNRVEIDGLVGEDFRLECPGFTIVMPLPARWSRQWDSASSVSFYFRGDRRATFSLSLYGMDEFIPDIKPASIKGYLEWLRLKYPELIEFHNDDGEFLPMGQSTRPLDRKNRVLIYSIAKPDGKSKKVTIFYEYFLETRGWILTCLLKGPKEVVESIRKDFGYLFFTSYIAEE